MKIRSARVSDAEAILRVYSPYVTDTAITFEYDVPTVEEFSERIASTLLRYPYLVAQEGDKIVGYAYAGVFKARAAYDRSCETSIYVARNARGKGYGRALYDELERRLVQQGILNLYACIGDPIVEDEYLTKDSERFHARMGFLKVGEFHACGYKFGRWYNMIWMEKIVGSHE